MTVIMRKIFLITLAVFVSMASFAVKLDHDAFFNDYLTSNIHKWGDRIDEVLEYDNKQLTQRNMLEVSNYLYGYIAVLLDEEKDKKAKEYLERWELILDDMEKVDSLRPYVYVYRCSVCAYKITLSSIKAISLGPKAMNYIDKALELEPNNPLAVGLKGNMLFYMPKAFGGDKHEALELYLRTMKLFPENLDPLFRWNKCGIMLCIAQAYEKTDQLDKAIEYCEQILLVQPNFSYIKNEYLPQLIFQ